MGCRPACSRRGGERDELLAQARAKSGDVLNGRACNRPLPEHFPQSQKGRSAYHTSYPRSRDARSVIPECPLRVPGVDSCLNGQAVEPFAKSFSKWALLPGWVVIPGRWRLPPSEWTAGRALSRRRVGPPPQKSSPFGSTSPTPPQGGSDTRVFERRLGRLRGRMTCGG